MKALIFSDIHFHHWNKYNENNRRLKNQLETLKGFFKIAFTQKVPLFFGGDMFMESESLRNGLLSMVLPYLLDLFNIYPGVNLYAISGNHDLEGDNSFKFRSPSYINTLANSIRNFHNLDFDKIEFEDFIVYGVPYIRYNDGVMDYINSLKISSDKKNILLMHSDFKGQKDTNGIVVGKGVGIDEEGLARFDSVWSGHIHKPGRVKKNIYSIGSPMQIRLSDMNGQFGYWTLSDDFNMKFREITTTPKFKYYNDEKEIDNDFDFWIRIPKEPDEIESLVHTDLDISNRLSLVKNYLGYKGFSGYDMTIRYKFLKDLINEVRE